jgi:hypothetical protein
MNFAENRINIGWFIHSLILKITAIFEKSKFIIAFRRFFLLKTLIYTIRKYLKK